MTPLVYNHQDSACDGLQEWQRNLRGVPQRGRPTASPSPEFLQAQVSAVLASEPPALSTGPDLQSGLRWRISECAPG